MTDHLLKGSENFYKKIFDSISDGILVVDKDCNFIAVNPAYLRLSGFSEEEIMGMNLLELKNDALAPEVMKSKIPKVGVGHSMTIKKKQDVTDNGCEFAIKTNKNYTYVSVAPIISGEESVGAVSTFKIMDDVRKKIEDYTRSIRRIENQLKSLHKSKITFDDIIGNSPAIKKTISIARKIAKTETSVLLIGESGTGKELFAQAIHHESQRSEQPFVALNCPCLSENLLESELFGYEEGAFSGAIKGGKIGLYEVADNGTLFLDEIGDLSLSNQSKILRVLETGQFLRVGGRKPIETNVRTIAATNRNLAEMIENKEFREDLYYRLCVIPITIPPLRARQSDIILLAQKFVEDFSGGGEEF